jgi:hypothetical protein
MGANFRPVAQEQGKLRVRTVGDVIAPHWAD